MFHILKSLCMHINGIIILLFILMDCTTYSANDSVFPVGYVRSVQ